MRIDNAKKITAVAGAAVLSIGIAGPALAGTGAAEHKDQSTTAQHAASAQAVTLAGMQARLVQRIDARLAWIVKVQARVSASTVLTDAQKADITARLTARSAALLALKAEILAATTKDAVHAALATAGIRGLFGADRDGRHHGRQVARTGDASSAAVRSDPAKVPATHRVGPGRSVHASAVCRHDAGRTVTFHQSGGQFASFGGHAPHAQHR
jgi:hypothetical protein